MKTYLQTGPRIVSLAFAILLGLTTGAHGDVPAMDVTVFNSAGKVAFRAPVSAKASFATRTLAPGRYVVQFNAKSAAAKNNQYLLVVSAGEKKVIAANVPGETFLGGGAAMRIQVGPGSNITGQIAKEQTADIANSKYRIIDGRRYVWTGSELGSNLGGRWVDASLAPTANLRTVRMEDLRKLQDQAGEGSMLSGVHYGTYPMHHGY